MTSKPRGRTKSGAPKPGPDLLARRDDFIQTFFRKGAQLTEELLKEDESLRGRVRELEAENAKLRAQLRSDDAIRELLAKIEHLESEKRELLGRFDSGGAGAADFATRFGEIEAENAKLASLYVASYQLHSTLDLRAILRQLKELLAQFVGARAFALYLADEPRKVLVPVASEGVSTATLAPVQAGQGAIGRAWSTAQASWVEGDSTAGSVEAPAACVPMRLDDRCVGVIVVFATFEQKPTFVEVDFELFKLLGAHAASALAAARLFAQHGTRIGPLSSFLELE
jgi:GAF domain-containing protein